MQIMVQYMMLEVVKVNQGIADKQFDVVLARWIPVLPPCELMSM